MKSRVVAANTTAQRVGKDFGQDYSKFGDLTDADVHQSSVDATKAKQQKRKAAIYNRNLQVIHDCEKEIEALALEAIKHGFTCHKTIVKYIADGLRAAGKYEAAIAFERESLKQDLRVTKAKNTAEIGLNAVEARGEIQLICTRYGIEVEFLQRGFQLRSANLRSHLQASADAKQRESIARQQQEAYWRGETNSTGSQKSLGDGLFQSVSKSLLGWFKI